MKLDKQQIQALAEKISRELNVQITKKNSAIRDRRKSLITKKLALKENKTLREYYQFVDKNNYHASAVETFIVNKYEKEFNLIPDLNNNKISQDDVRSEIILETIETENLDELIKKIKQKYERNI